MSTLAVILVLLGILIIILAIFGFVAAGRRRDSLDGDLRKRLEDANGALAAARAQDRGWERSTMEAAAREAVGGTVDTIDLVQVVDRPGTDDDHAVFRVVSGGDERQVVLGRRSGAWVAEQEG